MAMPLFIPGTCEYVTFNGKRDCVIKVTGLSWDYYLRWLGWAQYNNSHGGPYKKVAESEKKGQKQRSEKGEDVMPLALEREEGGQELRNVGSL